MIRKVKSDSYHLLHPKITFFLTSISGDGKPNVMTCAWSTPVSEEPPSVAVCVSKESYTSELIRQTKDFVINIPTKRFLEALWICGKTSGRELDKFKRAWVLSSQGRSVRPPIIDGCAGHIECNLWRSMDAGECFAFFGKVITAYADDRLLDKGLWSISPDIPLHLGESRIVYFRDE